MNNSQLKVNPIVHQPVPDTLNEFIWSNGEIDLSDLNSRDIDALSFYCLVDGNEDGSSPIIKSLRIAYDLVPELATNYQVVSTTADSITIGEDINLLFYVYNVVETKTDSFNVKVEVLNEDNSRQTIFSEKVDSLHYNEYKLFEVVHNTSSGSGSKSFLITIDSNNEVRELFEDNNFYSIPFYVQPDTTTPTITLTFDGNDILDGDYIAPNPVIQIELNDESLLPITDPSSVLLYLNDNLIPSDTSIISYSFSETNPKVTVDFTPAFPDGEYTLKVLWKDSKAILLIQAELKNISRFQVKHNYFTFTIIQIQQVVRLISHLSLLKFPKVFQ